MGPFLNYEEKVLLWIQDLGPYSQPFTSFVTYKWAQQAWALNQTRVWSFARDQCFSLFGPFLSCEIKWILWIQDLGLYSQHFTVFITCKWAHQAIVFHNNHLKRLARDKHPSLLGPFLSYEEKGLLWIQDLGPYSKHFIFFIIYACAQWARVSHGTRLERISRYKHPSLLGHS